MDQDFKYPWQQAMLNAFLAGPDSLAAKINVAAKAISARLTDNLTDREERAALEGALRSLRVLNREAEAPTKPAPPKKEGDIASPPSQNSTDGNRSRTKIHGGAHVARRPTNPGAGAFEDVKEGAHYHIRWSTKEILDWEAYGSRAEAETSAQQLVRPGETFTIEERDENCPRCWKSFQLKKADPNPNQTYPWQQTVFDALNEPDAERRIRKVNRAQRAVSARLSESIDSNEQAAIRAALRTLRLLVAEREEPQDESGEKKDIA